MGIPSQVQEIIDGSGNSFHAKVARWFKEKGWRVTVSPYYMDQAQQKARELDLIVEKLYPIQWFGGFEGEVSVRLFVECKFLPGYSVLWMTGKDKSAVEKSLCLSGKFRKDNAETGKHHYFQGERVAKLFASTKNGGHENDPFYKALNQSLSALVSMREQRPRLLAESKLGGFKHHLDFPVIVCNSFSQLYTVDFDGVSVPSPISDNFHLEVQYAFIDRYGKMQDEFFLIDVVPFDGLEKLVEEVEVDADVVGHLASS